MFFQSQKIFTAVNFTSIIDGEITLAGNFSDICDSGFITASGELTNKFNSQKVKTSLSLRYNSPIQTKKVKMIGEFVSNNYFASMLPQYVNGTWICGTPEAKEFRGMMFTRVWVCFPDISLELEVPPAHVGGPFFLETGDNSSVKWGFSLWNGDGRYSRSDGTFGDAFAEDALSYVRESKRFIRIGILTVCGDEKREEIFNELVIKSVDGKGDDKSILSISGIDIYSEILSRKKDWPAFCGETSCQYVTPDDLPVWGTSTAYAVGDVVQMPLEWEWTLTTSFKGIFNSSNYQITRFAEDTPKLWHIPKGFPVITFDPMGDYIRAILKFRPDGAYLIVYSSDLSQTEVSKVPQLFDNFFSGEADPPEIGNSTVLFYSRWLYPRISNLAFRCTQAGTSGSSAPDWKPFSLDFQSENNYLSWRNENIENDTFDTSNLGGAYVNPTTGQMIPSTVNCGITPLTLLLRGGITDVTTDGTCLWEAYYALENSSFFAEGITLQRYNRYYGCRLLENWIEVFYPEDFSYNVTSNIFKFTYPVSADTPVQFRSPISVKWMLAYILTLAMEEAFSYNNITTPTVMFRFDFFDFKFQDTLQTNGKTAIQMIQEILSIFGGRFAIQPYDGNKLMFIIGYRPTRPEINNAQPDFVIPEQLIRGVRPQSKSFKRINAINVIKPAKAKEVKVKLK